MIAVIGLGYVGMPLAVEFAKHFDVVGYDNEKLAVRHQEGELENVDKFTPAGSFLLTTDRNELKNPEIKMYVICVPTPVDNHNKADLRCLTEACHNVGNAMMCGNKSAVVVFESTVYPGCTRDHCRPIIEKYIGQTLRYGYSPERINPGDNEHSLTKVTKIIAGVNLDTLNAISCYYQYLGCPLHKAESVEVAEAAKIIENTQRDINIALVNELAQIFDKMQIPFDQVLAAARTKWNWVDFKPGLVGGHCIGVDPYYLAYAAEGEALHPQMILAGRRTNEGLVDYIARKVMYHGPKRVAILGLTFKANCDDFRNSKALELMFELKKYDGLEILAHDPYDEHLQQTEYYTPFNKIADCDVVIRTVDHMFYVEHAKSIEQMVKPGGKYLDIPNWRFT